MPNDGIQLLKVGDRLRLRIDNQSEENTLYVSVLDLGTSGKISLLTAKGTGTEILPGKTFQTEVLRVGTPPGLETYKVIGSTDPGVDLRPIEQPGIASRDTMSPLAWFLTQGVDSKPRDTNPDATMKLSSWTTGEIDVKVCNSEKSIEECKNLRHKEVVK